MLLFGIDLQARGGFISWIVSIPGPSKAGKSANPRGNKDYLLAQYRSLFRDFKNISLSPFSCCFRDNCFSKCPHLCVLSGAPGDLIFATSLNFPHFVRGRWDLRL